MMWSHNKLAVLLKIAIPLIQAPMAGGATTPELIAAVCNAGGLGSLGAGYMQPEAIRTAIREIRKLTNKPFSVNLFVPETDLLLKQSDIEKAILAIQASCKELDVDIPFIEPPYHPSFEAQMQILLEEEVPVYSFTFGMPATDWIAKFKKKNIILIGTATSLEEAALLEEQGIDVIAAQGSEAGGHRGTFIGKCEDALIDIQSLVVSMVSNLKSPILAAGGIMDEQGIFTALSLGASGVQMGTAFLTCHESGINQAYKNLLLKTLSDNTVLTRAFSGKYARGIDNQFIHNMNEHLDAILPYPIQNALTTKMRKKAAQDNNTDYMSMWAGQAAYLCKNVSASELISSLDQKMRILLKQ